MNHHQQAQRTTMRNNNPTSTAVATTATRSSPTDGSVLTCASSDDDSRMPGTTTTSTSSFDAHQQEKLLWAKVLASKAHAETTNIAKRMGKMEELEKGMALLERMRAVIGDEVYANRVKSLFSALPNFNNFDAAVNIIDVDATAPVDRRSTRNAGDRTPDKNEQCWSTTKRRLSPDEDDEEGQNKKNKVGKTETVNDQQENCYVLTEEDEARYITYHNITDATGKVVAVHAVDSRSKL
jgi:hypothetical protein